MRSDYKFKCKECGNAMVKAGKNSTGKQRYKCNNCNTRTLIKKEDKSRQNELTMFVKWLIDSTKVEHRMSSSRSTFYRKTKWCWSVVPKIKSDGISSDFIFVDATYLGRDMCLLVVRNKDVVLNFKWAKQEDYESYYELLKPIEKPNFVICDGHKAIAKACTKLWKNVSIQRCIVHIARSTERKLGKRSTSEVNQVFRKHIKKLTVIDTETKAIN
jgi:DNA-directed RNA polymerase subunit RPC12/RpoP